MLRNKNTKTSYRKIVQFLLLFNKNNSKCCDHFNILKQNFSGMYLVNGNYWSKCYGVNGLSLFKTLFLMFVGGDIEH
jgi:hypothetical protein